MEQTGRRGRQGSRSRGSGTQRSSEPGQNPHLVVPYITRGIPTYDIVGEESLTRIEATADRLLAEIGIEFREDPETVDLFRAAGGEVRELSGDRWNIRFQPGMIREILKTAPARFTQHARNPANSVQIGGDAVVFAPSYGSPFVMDLDQGRRYGTIEDFRNFIKLGQSCPWLHHSGGTICEPTDVAVNKRHLDMVYSHIKYSDRAFLGSITAPERAEDSIEMARILFGADFVDANQGSIHLPFLLGGAVAPLTMAGAVAQCLAESMVSCALTQLVRPGAPAILASFLSSMSLRSGSPTFGTPEPALGSLVMGQLARRLDMPLRCAGNFSTSKLPDAQAMQQSMMSMMSAVQCGAHYVLHSAGFLDGLLSMSYEKFMLDADLCGMLHAYLNGITVDDETLGLEALAEGGPGAHLFGTQHTLRHYQTAYYDSALDDNQNWESWDEQGGIDAATRANARWKHQLATYHAPPLDDATDAALVDFIARKKASMPDAWY